MKIPFGVMHTDRIAPLYAVFCRIGAFPMAAELGAVRVKVLRHLIRDTVHADSAVCAQQNVLHNSS